MSFATRGARRGGRTLARRTRRLEIRPLRAGDYAKWREAALAIDPRKKNRWDMRPPLRELTRARFAKVLKRQENERNLDLFYDFVIIRKDTGDHVGKVAIMAIDRGITQMGYLASRIERSLPGSMPASKRWRRASSPA